MSRRPHPVPAVKLPLFDYEGWAARLVKSVREGRTVEDAVASAEMYAKDVRDIECAIEASRLIARGAEQIRMCAVPVAVIAHWQQAAIQEFGSGREFTDRKFTRFLASMYRDVRAAQVAEATREAAAQAKVAETIADEQRAAKWRAIEANLDAMRRSISEGGFVPVPYP